MWGVSLLFPSGRRSGEAGGLPRHQARDGTPGIGPHPICAGLPQLSRNLLKISKDSTGNAILADAVDRAAEAVRGGEPLAGPLGASRVFPPAIVDMIAVAEESNTLDKVLVEIANTQEERTARQIDFTMRMLEPLLLMMMGIMIAFIAIALLVPILRMATSGLR